LLSILRTRSILLKAKNELVAICPTYLNTQLAKKFIDQLENAYNHSKYRVGNKLIKLPKIKD
jgi:hypothetical protein